MNGEFYKIVAKPVTIYRSGCWALNKEEEMKMKVAETRTPRQLCGMARLDRIENECIKRSLGATDIVGKTKDNKLRMLREVDNDEIVEEIER